VQKVCKEKKIEGLLFYVIIFFLKVLREVRCQSWGVLVSQPFQGRILFFFSLKEKYLIDN
jgi:hypothetical protein